MPCTTFSPNGKYLAICGKDGKLKIWETASNLIKQEFDPENYNLSPCNTVEWIFSSWPTTKIRTSTRKKSKKKSIGENTEHEEIIAIGSTNGTVCLYDISKSVIVDSLENGHTSAVTALTWSSVAGLFSAGEDKQIVEWNLQEKMVKFKWKSGRVKVTSLAILPDGNTILSGEKKIKWWDLKTKKIIKTFDGHNAQVNILQCIEVMNETCYLFSSALSNESCIKVWALNKSTQNTLPSATLSLVDEPVSLSVKLVGDSQVWVSSVVKSGDVQLFKYQPNGITTKEIQSALTVQVATNGNKVAVIAAKLMESGEMLLAFGSLSSICIEIIVPDFSLEIQCLEKMNLTKLKVKKDETKTKLTPHKDRLKNLNLQNETFTLNQSLLKDENISQLLTQNLVNGDQTLLYQILSIKEENIIKSVVARMAVSEIVPLVKIITSMLQKNRNSFAKLWWQEIKAMHTETLISLPNKDEIIDPIIKILHVPPEEQKNMIECLGKVKFIVSLLVQRKEIKNQGKNLQEESVLVYQSEDSSQEDVDINKTELNSESGDSDWEETSEQEPMQVDMVNGKSDDESSIYSSN